MKNVSRETSTALRGRAIVIAAVLLLALAAAGCGGVARPNGWAGPAIEGDAMYVNVEGDVLAAMSVDGREERWRFPDDRTKKKAKVEGIYGEPAIAGDRVLVGGYDGNLYALSARDGGLQWTAETDGPIIGGAAIVGDVAIAGSGDGYVYAFAVADGTRRWRFKTGDRVWAKPAVQGDVAYVPSFDGKLYALRVSDGTPVWKEPFQAEAGLPATATLAGDLVIVGSLDKRLYAVRQSDGSVAWSFKADNWFWTTPLVQDGRVYAGNLDDTVYALRLSDGGVVWRYDAEAPVRAAPVLRDGVVVVAAKDGFVHGIKADSGERAWLTGDLQTSLYANLTLRDASAYVRGKNGALWSVRAADGSVTQLRTKS